ncbi:MAG: hypothetical protein AAFX40_13650 [Cyanobacteria bacterium J06639_1]
MLSEVHSWISKREHSEIARSVLANLHLAVTMTLLDDADLTLLIHMLRALPDGMERLPTPP